MSKGFLGCPMPHQTMELSEKVMDMDKYKAKESMVSEKVMDMDKFKTKESMVRGIWKNLDMKMT